MKKTACFFMVACLWGSVAALAAPPAGEAAATKKKTETTTQAVPPPPENDVIQEYLGMSPEEIRRYRSEKGDRKEATHEPRREVRQVTRSVALDLSPGASPEKIRLFDRAGAVVVFSDSTGAPWPVVGVQNFAQDQFEVVQPGIADSPVVMISTKIGYGQGGAAVFLKDMPTPILLTMVTGGGVADSRVDAIVSRRGPKATAPAIEQQTAPEFDPKLLDFLTKTPPSGAKQLTIQVDDRDAATETTAWVWNDKLYIRTPLTVMSPAWRGVAKSNDGMSAYVFEMIPVLLVSNKGKVHTLRVGL